MKVLKFLVKYFNYCLKFLWYSITWPYYLYKYYWGWGIEKTKCPNCNKWTSKENLVSEEYIGEKKIKVLKRDIHYLRVGYKKEQRQRFVHEYYDQKVVSNYNITIKCRHCSYLWKQPKY